MSYIEVISKDGVPFNFTKEEIRFSNLLDRTVSDLTVISKLNLTQIDSETLQKIHLFLRFSVNPPRLFSPVSQENSLDDLFVETNTSDKLAWIPRFLNENHEYLSKLLDASIFLEITTLTEAITSKIAEQIQNCQSIEEMRSSFKIRNDFTPGTEESVMKQISWALSPS